MTAYTEANFNACLEVINVIRGQRDEAIRIARSLTLLNEEDYHDQMCDCKECKLKERLEELISKVIAMAKDK
jgi:hypothetical protein